MKPERTDYGNWVPKRILLLALVGWVVFAALAILPLPTILRVAALVVAGFALLCFAHLACLYVAFAANDGELQRRWRQNVLDHLPDDWQGRALDIGTGSGALGILLAQEYPGATVVGLDYWGTTWDYSQQMCERNAAIKGVDERIMFQKGTASALPFDDGSFDVVVSSFTFHEVRDAKDKRDVVREALRVLRKGGWFSLQDVFLDKRIYGDVDALLNDVHEWGVEQVYLSDASSLDWLPSVLKLRTPLTMGVCGVIYGKK
jgi:ubiquinone/menaquinone biosynthesis C-methylase UbiE